MRFLDLHCDTAGECFLQQKPLSQNDLHISLARAACFSQYVQLFAVWIPDEKRGEEAYRYYRAVLDNFRRELKENDARIALCTSAKAMQAALAAGKTAALAAVEGGAVLGGRLDRLDALYEDGVRLLTLTWNGVNELGSGCFAKPDGGLSDFGRRVVDAMQEKGILVDVSHLGRRGFWEVADRVNGPFLASHSNAAIVDNPYAAARNLSDRQIEEIVRHRGLIGLNLCADFLGNNGDTGCDAVLRQIAHFLELGAEDCLAFGCDFDGCTVNPVFAGVERIPALYAYLLAHGVAQKTLNKLFFENGRAFLIANL